MKFQCDDTETLENHSKYDYEPTHYNNFDPLHNDSVAWTQRMLMENGAQARQQRGFKPLQQQYQMFSSGQQASLYQNPLLIAGQVLQNQQLLMMNNNQQQFWQFDNPHQLHQQSLLQQNSITRQHKGSIQIIDQQSAGRRGSMNENGSMHSLPDGAEEVNSISPKFTATASVRQKIMTLKEEKQQIEKSTGVNQTPKSPTRRVLTKIAGSASPSPTVRLSNEVELKQTSMQRNLLSPPSLLEQKVPGTQLSLAQQLEKPSAKPVIQDQSTQSMDCNMYKSRSKVQLYPQHLQIHSEQVKQNLTTTPVGRKSELRANSSMRSIAVGTNNNVGGKMERKYPLSPLLKPSTSRIIIMKDESIGQQSPQSKLERFNEDIENTVQFRQRDTSTFRQQQQQQQNMKRLSSASNSVSRQQLVSDNKEDQTYQEVSKIMETVAPQGPNPIQHSLLLLSKQQQSPTRHTQSRLKLQVSSPQQSPSTLRLKQSGSKYSSQVRLNQKLQSPEVGSFNVTARYQRNSYQTTVPTSPNNASSDNQLKQPYQTFYNVTAPQDSQLINFFNKTKPQVQSSLTARTVRTSYQVSSSAIKLQPLQNPLSNIRNSARNNVTKTEEGNGGNLYLGKNPQSPSALAQHQTKIQQEHQQKLATPGKLKAIHCNRFPRTIFGISFRHPPKQSYLNQNVGGGLLRQTTKTGSFSLKRNNNPITSKRRSNLPSSDSRLSDALSSPRTARNYKKESSKRMLNLNRDLNTGGNNFTRQVSMVSEDSGNNISSKGFSAPIKIESRYGAFLRKQPTLKRKSTKTNTKAVMEMLNRGYKRMDTTQI